MAGGGLGTCAVTGGVVAGDNDNMQEVVTGNLYVMQSDGLQLGCGGGLGLN